MSFYFHPDAEIELQQAINYYEGSRVNLGYDFALEVYAAIHRAGSMPKAWAEIERAH